MTFGPLTSSFFVEPDYSQRFLFSVLSPGGDTSNVTVDIDFNTCGVNYCPWTGKEEAKEVANDTSPAPKDDNFSTSKNQLYTLAGVYLVCSIASAIVVALFVDPLSKYE